MVTPPNSSSNQAQLPVNLQTTEPATQDNRILSIALRFFENIEYFFEKHVSYLMIASLAFGITLIFFEHIALGISLIALSSIGLLVVYFHEEKTSEIGNITEIGNTNVSVYRLCGIVNDRGNCWANSTLQYFMMSDTFMKIVNLLPENNPLGPLKTLIQEYQNNQVQGLPCSRINIGRFLRQHCPNEYAPNGGIECPEAGLQLLVTELKTFLQETLRDHPENEELQELRANLTTLTEITTWNAISDEGIRFNNPQVTHELFPVITVNPFTENSLENGLNSQWFTQVSQTDQPITRRIEDRDLQFRTTINREYNSNPREWHIRINRTQIGANNTEKTTNRFTLPPEYQNRQLKSFICHLGSGHSGGHYIAYKKLDAESYARIIQAPPPENFTPGWYLCDDQNVLPVVTDQQRSHFETHKNHYAIRALYISDPQEAIAAEPEVS